MAVAAGTTMWAQQLGDHFDVFSLEMAWSDIFQAWTAHNPQHPAH